MLRIGVDMDGVLADFEAAFRGVEVRLFGPAEHIDGGQPEKEEESQTASEPPVADEEGQAKDCVVSERLQRRRRDSIRWIARSGGWSGPPQLPHRRQPAELYRRHLQFEGQPNSHRPGRR
jgi:hypothetical protein